MQFNKGFDTTLEPAYFARNPNSPGRYEQRITALEESDAEQNEQISSLQEQIKEACKCRAIEKETINQLKFTTDL